FGERIEAAAGAHCAAQVIAKYECAHGFGELFRRSVDQTAVALQTVVDEDVGSRRGQNRHTERKRLEKSNGQAFIGLGQISACAPFIAANFSYSETKPRCRSRGTAGSSIASLPIRYMSGHPMISACACS